MVAELDYMLDFEKVRKIERMCEKIGVIGNGCYENPEGYDVCRGTEELLKQATHAVRNGTTVYLYRCPPDFY